MKQTTVFLVQRNGHHQLLQILPGGKTVVDSNGNEIKLVGSTPSVHQWRDTIGWWWKEVPGENVVIDGDVPDESAFLVHRNDLFKILLLIPVEGGDAVDANGRKYRSGKSHAETGRAGTWWCGRTGQVWREVEGPPPVEVSTAPSFKTFSVFRVEEKSYIDQWGFERAEKIAATARTLFVEESGAMKGMAHDRGGQLYVETVPGSGQWHSTPTGSAVWYSDGSYPGQLMKRTRVGVKAARLTMKIRNQRGECK